MTTQPNSATTDANPMVSAAIELRGHLIDSLTLAKVMDMIQAEGCDCQLNDIHLGTSKKDPSSVNLSLYAPSQEVLDRLLVAIEPYGAHNLGKANAQLVPLDSPELNKRRHLENLFYVRLPEGVCVDGKWLPVTVDLQDLVVKQARGGTETQSVERHILVIAVNAEKTQARIARADNLHTGEMLVSGHQGIRW